MYCFLYAEPKLLAHVCAEALAGGIEVEYARELIRRLRLAPPPSAALRDSWCWPLRIHALGRFELLIDDRPLASNGKAQKKTLELLKALVALGARDVDAGTFADALWPDADGDAARSALDMALHRLRKLLGRDDAVLMRDGKASLNADVCWLDVWAFESGLEQGDAGRALEALSRLAAQQRARFELAAAGARTAAPTPFAHACSRWAARPNSAGSGAMLPRCTKAAWSTTASPRSCTAA